MNPPVLGFEVPRELEARRTPEDRGIARDGVRLLVSGPGGETHRRFSELPEILHDGDLLVVNESATLAASLPARGPIGDFRASVSTAYGADLWLIEPRWDFGRPGPLPLAPGDVIDLGGVRGRYVTPFPGIPRLGFFRAEGDLRPAMERTGAPIRYGYLAREYPLREYQTVFGRVPGSAEMPSAARPFTRRLVHRLTSAGVRFAPVLLHAGVSSLETGDAGPSGPPIYPEPFEVPAATVEEIRATRARGGRVIGVGTTVARAIESATDECGIRPARGFTRLFIAPERPARGLDGLLTGFHEGVSTHLALLAGFAGIDRIRRAYRAAVDARYLWHEFGDSHLMLLR